MNWGDSPAEGATERDLANTRAVIAHLAEAGVTVTANRTEIATEVLCSRLEMVSALCLIQVELLTGALADMPIDTADRLRLAASVDGLTHNVKYTCEKAASLKCAMLQK